MIFDFILGNKKRKAFAMLLISMLIAVFWYTEKTKRISPYGILFYKMGLHCDDTCGEDEPLRYFQKAIRHNPNLSAAHYQLALIYEKRGDYKKSLQSFKRVAELDYQNTFAFYRVGLQYFKEGDYEYARRYLLQSYKGRDRPDDVVYYLAQIYDYMEDYDLAVSYYHSIVSLQPEFAPKVYPRLAEIYYFHVDKDSVLHDIAALQSTSRESAKHRGLAAQLRMSYEAVNALEKLKISTDQ